MAGVAEQGQRVDAEGLRPRMAIGIVVDFSSITSLILAVEDDTAAAYYPGPAFGHRRAAGPGDDPRRRRR